MNSKTLSKMAFIDQLEQYVAAVMNFNYNDFID